MTRLPSVLVAHNSYQDPGGEDIVVRKERYLLEAAGHRVVVYNRDNGEIEAYSVLGKLGLLGRAIWATDSGRAIRVLLREHKPDVIHVHNTFPLISPGVYYAAKAQGLPVIQTLHNYRLWCVNGLFFRDGHSCEKCLTRAVPWPGVWHACYRKSYSASGLAAASLTAHRLLRTWDRMVDLYVAPTEFAKRKHVQGGLAEEKVVIKPNFVHPDPGVGDHSGQYALFVGRLSPEKGLSILLSAWRKMGGRVPLKIVGDGPVAPAVELALREIPNLEWYRRQPEADVASLMRQATMLILPSVAYEVFGLVVPEALSTGLPAIVSGHGALAEIVDDGRTGLQFRPGDADDLAAKVEWAWTHPREMAEMGCEARLEYERKYTAERNYQMLMEIYEMAIARSRH